MKLFLQLGYGMMGLCKELIGEWGEGTVILSPRDLEPQQLVLFSNEIRGLNGQVLLDPQFYQPSAEHYRLCKHTYWPPEYESSGFWAGAELTRLTESLAELNDELGCQDFIAPGLYASDVDDLWLDRQVALLEALQKYRSDGRELLATVALPEEVVRDEAKIELLLEASEEWKADGVYLVCEHPNGDYLVKDPTWLANVVDLVAGLQLNGKRVILGYSNHQMLIAACASIHAIASGTWMNVRSFPPDKFRTQYEEEVKQRATWYYAPRALSEYKIPFLDIAARQGVLDLLRPPEGFEDRYCQILFQGVQPSTVGYGEPQAFRHYLACLRDQVADARKDSFDATVAHHEGLLDTAEQILTSLHAAGVRGQMRDFKDCIDINRAALAVLQSSRGALLRRRWNQL